jgi:hypothetical protein
MQMALQKNKRGTTVAWLPKISITNLLPNNIDTDKKLTLIIAKIEQKCNDANY